ncbi:MAG TPA: methyltransferase domain-containing protein [Haliangiales bacterium]|nr:methyltransferase domain-containing protein [Haliangiales bacterium]
MRLPLLWLDPWLLRAPFEGRAARRYVAAERCAFGDLDERLLDRFDAELRAARTFLDVGAGTGEFAAKVAARHPHLHVWAIEPSRAFARVAPVRTLRARAERLPLASSSVDFAVLLSSLRHVRGRRAALAELRRVVRPTGVAYVIELDPAADRGRARRHVAGMRSLLSRLTFDPWVLRTCPGAPAFARAAHDVGWRVGDAAPDPKQPFYTLRLT